MPALDYLHRKQYLRNEITKKKMYRNIRITLTILLLTLGLTAKAQEENTFSYIIQYNTHFTDGENAPYWFTALRQGMNNVVNNDGYIRIGILNKGKLDKKGQFKYTIGADIRIGETQTNSYQSGRNILLQQAYIEAQWRNVVLSIGSKERFSETTNDYAPIVDGQFSSNLANLYFPNIYKMPLDNLGSGGLAYSGNSRPIPQVRIEIPNYIPFPGTNQWLHFRGHIAYGMFTDENFQTSHASKNATTRYGKNILYHSKAGFIRIGKVEKFPLMFEGGLEMYTQFGGDIYSNSDGKILSMPNALADYWKAFIPLSGSDDTPEKEQTNISGNQLGSWHATFIIPTKAVDIRLYGEHLFEDFSQLFFFEYQSDRNGKKNIIYYPWKDIKLGIRLTNKSKAVPFISSMQYEYLTTRDQSGALYHDPSDYFSEQMDGADNYYNHGIYPGWHHWGMGIGNPLVIAPAYNSNGSLQFRSNRITAHNVGINGTFSKWLPLGYRLQYTYSEHWGTYSHPFDQKRYSTSILTELICAPQKSSWAGMVSIGYDKSSYIGNNTGIMFTLSYTGEIKKWFK